jgi:hypothetical protein
LYKNRFERRDDPADRPACAAWERRRIDDHQAVV